MKMREPKLRKVKHWLKLCNMLVAELGFKRNSCLITRLYLNCFVFQPLFVSEKLSLLFGAFVCLWKILAHHRQTSTHCCLDVTPHTSTHCNFTCATLSDISFLKQKVFYISFTTWLVGAFDSIDSSLLETFSSMGFHKILTLLGFSLLTFLGLWVASFFSSVLMCRNSSYLSSVYYRSKCFPYKYCPKDFIHTLCFVSICWYSPRFCLEPTSLS